MIIKINTHCRNRLFYSVKLFIIINLFLSDLTNAQTFRFFYELSYKNDSLQKKYSRMKTILDISSENVKFYDLQRSKIDSTKSKITANLPINIIIKRKKGENLNLNYVFIGLDYYSYNSNDQIEWKLINELKILKTTNYKKLLRYMVEGLGKHGFHKKFHFKKVLINSEGFQD